MHANANALIILYCISQITCATSASIFVVRTAHVSTAPPHITSSILGQPIARRDWITICDRLAVVRRWRKVTLSSWSCVVLETLLPTPHPHPHTELRVIRWLLLFALWHVARNNRGEISNIRAIMRAPRITRCTNANVNANLRRICAERVLRTCDVLAAPLVEIATWMSNPQYTRSIQLLAEARGWQGERARIHNIFYCSCVVSVSMYVLTFRMTLNHSALL